MTTNPELTTAFTTVTPEPIMIIGKNNRQFSVDYPMLRTKAEKEVYEAKAKKLCPELLLMEFSEIMMQQSDLYFSCGCDPEDFDTPATKILRDEMRRRMNHCMDAPKDN